jgi:chromosome segregation ATPase
MANSPEAMERLAHVEDKVDELGRNVSVLKTDVSVLKTDVSVLKTDVHGIKVDVGDIKTAIWRLTEIVADHSERFSSLEKSLDTRFQSINDRLDRLVAMSLRERTESVERLARVERTASDERLGEIERRLTRLEERVGD